jgi:CRP/FNR family transcriptional regulator, cyclic AMP receptor protein
VSPIRAKVTDETIVLMRNITILSSLGDPQLRHLIRDSFEEVYSEGATVVTEGEKGRNLYLMLEGEVEVRRKGRRLATLSRGQFFGEISIFTDHAISADVIAATPSRLLVLSKWEFWRYALDKPWILRKMIEEMARRLAESNRALS